MKIQELLGIRYPLIQGGMANIATGNLPLPYPMPEHWG